MASSASMVVMPLFHVLALNWLQPYISFAAPTLTLLPEVATILPGQTELELMCTVNSNALQVRWFSGTTELSSSSTYTVELPTDTLEYTCSAIDSATDTVEASGVVRVRNVQGKQFSCQFSPDSFFRF